MGSYELDGRTVETSSEDKLLFEDPNVSKGRMLEYYREVGSVMVPYMEDRPLTLHRFPDGLQAGGFYQQQRADYFPDYVGACPAAHVEDEGTTVHAVCNNRAALLYLANQGTVEFHAWLARRDEMRRPDRIVFDLDPPGEGENFDSVRRAARDAAALLGELEVTPFCMTTGSRGLHVIVPIRREADFDDARSLAAAIAEELARRHPDRLTTAQRKKKRQGRLYLDVMRNAYGQTAVVPYSLRARPGAPVATPIDWDELDADMHPRRYHIGNLLRRLGQRDDPWEDMARHGVSPAALRDRVEALAGGD